MKWIWSPFLTFSLAMPSTGFSPTTLIVSTAGSAVVVGATSVVVAAVVAGATAVVAAAVDTAAGAAVVVLSVELSLPQAATRPVDRTSASTLVIVRFMVAPRWFAVSGDGERRRATAHRLEELDPARAQVGAIGPLVGPIDVRGGAALEAARDRDGGARQQARGNERDDAEGQLQDEAGQYRRLRERVDRQLRRGGRALGVLLHEERRAGQHEEDPAGTDPVAWLRRISRVWRASDANSATTAPTASAGSRSSHACPAAAAAPDGSSQ